MKNPLETLRQDIPNIPFDIGSELGRGAFAYVNLCRDNHSGRLLAVKFINKLQATKSQGGVSMKQIACEVALHQLCGDHDNVVSFIGTDEGNIWRWIAMEYAEGGDLFDKIEPDVGVDNEIAQFYFVQLVNGVSVNIYGKDIKPENILLDANGNLKIADFGLASLYRLKGKERLLHEVCGSPPYVAPEIVMKYSGSLVDTWSCGIVLFVLLLGNTPWDEPTERSREFVHFAQHFHNLDFEPWNRLEPSALSLIQSLLTIDPNNRICLDKSLQHSWVNRPNQFLGTSGQCRDPITLATSLMAKMKVDLFNSFSDEISENKELGTVFSQPELQTREVEFLVIPRFISASQPTCVDIDTLTSLSEDPCQSQFSGTPGVPESLTQRAQKFQDVCPSERLTRFHSLLPSQELIIIVLEILQAMRVSVLQSDALRVKLMDRRKCPLHGEICIVGIGKNVNCVKFVKRKGDPLEWRRFFKVSFLFVPCV
ncbi:Serine/threonine-protein kinase chk1 [Neolecta irregularis DAH-3]|uniref:non-specific serine/threonine protein kinase n=1 Tax=Neolecta irregularis (strain DAH-3) TaxID=1198029 RepID=A0A1U7LHC4_NEOID|nr:Serine/threonine-protein kinase chk1 [Neolecta irregularis DAH-3]|eukprot:OLL22028.1 Serine/threonine-protein kinase chk1 [Neolecta irregularis DAH-3]